MYQFLAAIVVVGVILAVLDYESQGAVMALFLKAGFWIAVIMIALVLLRGC